MLDARRLAQTIANEAATSEGTSEGIAAGATPAATFCSIWPSAKPVLVGIAGFIVFIPGAGTTAGAVLRGLIQVGDQIAAEVCK